MADDYDVGYGKPPKHTRFSKGQSGNLRGRPKVSPNLQTEMKRLVAAKTKIKFDGVIQTVPRTRALCLTLIQLALRGSVRAFAEIVRIIGPEIADELKATAAGLTSADVDIVRRALAREEAAVAGAASSAAIDPPTKID